METANKRVKQAILRTGKHASTKESDQCVQQKNAAATISATEQLGSVREPPTKTINFGTSWNLEP